MAKRFSRTQGKRELYALPPASPRRADSSQHITQRFGNDVCFDIIGPLQETKRENQFLVLLTDCFSLFPIAEAFPRERLNESEIANFIFEWITIFGHFETLITGENDGFMNSVIEKLQRIMNVAERIEIRAKTSGDPDMKAALEDFLKKAGICWDHNDLRYEMFRLRNNILNNSNTTPYQIVFGHKSRAWGLMPTSLSRPPSDVVVDTRSEDADD